MKFKCIKRYMSEDTWTYDILVQDMEDKESDQVKKALTALGTRPEYQVLGAVHTGEGLWVTIRALNEDSRMDQLREDIIAAIEDLDSAQDREVKAVLIESGTWGNLSRMAQYAITIGPNISSRMILDKCQLSQEEAQKVKENKPKSGKYAGLLYYTWDGIYYIFKNAELLHRETLDPIIGKGRI